MVRVSVIVGYYNRASLLERTLDSILAQDFDDFELLVFDDASTDNTAERLRRYVDVRNDPRIRALVHEENLGFVQGLVNAIERSTGEYIAIQGSGDESLPTRLSEQVQLLDNRPEVGAVGSWYYNIVESTGVRRLRKPDADGVGFSELLRGNVFSHGEVMFRRGVYEKVGGYRTAFKNSQDYDLWLRISRISKLATVKEILYHRYVQFDGVSYDPKKLVVQSRYGMLARKIAQLEEPEASDLVRKLETEGPEALVPLETPELQQKYVKRALRSAVWGEPESAITTAREYIVNPWKRGAILVAIKLYSSPLGWPARKLARKLFKLDKI